MATAQEIRELSIDELKSRVEQLRASIFDMKIRCKTGGLNSFTEVRKSRHDLARILTVLAEKERNNG
jgi:large subunit ribosomal protein L29